MKKSILEIYALAVCFFALFSFVVTLGNGLNSFVQVLKPELTLDLEQYKQHQSNSAFWEFQNLPAMSEGIKPKERPSESELTRQRLESYENLVATQRRIGLPSVVSAVIVILVEIIIFYVHWCIARRVRNEGNF